MGKKHKKKDIYDGYDYSFDESVTSTSNLKGIVDIIEAEYITPNELCDLKSLMERIPLLEDNHLCMTLTGCHDYYSWGEYPLICYEFIKRDKSLKKFLRTPGDYDLGQKNNTYSNTPKISLKYVEYALESPGTYAVQLDDLNFMILSVKDSDDNYMDVDYKVHFIGPKCMKYYKKMHKKTNDFCSEVNKATKNDTIMKMHRGGATTISTSLFKTMDELIFPNKKEVTDYIDNWKKNIPVYYEKYNIIPKLSIMIYGDPGTGKSTFAKALAKYLGLNSVTLVNQDIFSEDGNGTGERSTGKTSYTRSIITLDDIDCICKSRDKDKSAENAKILSNLLEFLDNPPTFYFKADNNVNYPVSIVVATTNFIDVLDPAVKRHGRFDLTFEMHDLDYEHACEMTSKYGLKLEDIVEVKNKSKFTISPSYLQAICVDNIDKSLKVLES